MRIGIERRDDGRGDEQRNVDAERRCLEDEEVQRDRDARHPLEDAVEAEASSSPSGSESSPPMPTISADSERTSLTTRRREKPERAQRGDLAEPLVDRDGQQHGDEQHGKRRPSPWSARSRSVESR